MKWITALVTASIILGCGQAAPFETRELSTLHSDNPTKRTLPLLLDLLDGKLLNKLGDKAGSSPSCKAFTPRACPAPKPYKKRVNLGLIKVLLPKPKEKRTLGLLLKKLKDLKDLKLGGAEDGKLAHRSLGNAIETKSKEKRTLRLLFELVKLKLAKLKKLLGQGGPDYSIDFPNGLPNRNTPGFPGGGYIGGNPNAPCAFNSGGSCSPCDFDADGDCIPTPGAPSVPGNPGSPDIPSDPTAQPPTRPTNPLSAEY